ncbi:VOC family protein [Luteolibacter sp. LG18]|uniref:VOC family protein n=1 Tax=Luteolibacter sp. LG18 TaxID=2819286 RepID=UPI002B2923F3|nr:glyoxalase [Luteolibacter sp. LG18]
MSESHIPEGYHSVTPSLTVADAPAALAFYQAAFGAVEIFRMPDEKTGKIMHAEIAIGNSRLMLSSEFPEWGCVAPEVGTGGAFMIYVADVDAAYAQAVGAGATSLQEPTDMFWGDRTSRVADPHGYRWSLATHVRDVSPEEIAKAAKEWDCNAS